MEKQPRATFLSPLKHLAVCILFLIGATFSCFSQAEDQRVYVALNLASLKVGADYPAGRPPETDPQALPFVSQCAGKSTVRVETDSDGKKVLVLKKAKSSAGVGIAFEFMHQRPLATGQLILDLGALLESQDQTGNIVIAFEFGSDLVSYLQIEASGNVQLIQKGKQRSVLSLGHLVLGYPVKTLKYELNFTNGQARVLVDDKPLGSPGSFAVDRPINSLVFGISGLDVSRTFTIGNLTLTHFE